MIAYPDGLDRTWNAGACCGPARDRGVDDVGFLDALVAALRRDDGVGDVYAVGFSNGAMMSYAWACARPGALAGIGPVAGAPDRRLPGAGAADRRGRARDPRRAGADRGRPRTVRRDVPVAGRLARPVPDRRRLPDDRRPWSTPRPPGSTRGRAPGTPW